MMKDDEESLRRRNGAFYYRKGMELAFTPLSDADRFLIQGENARVRGDVDSAEVYYSMVLSD